MTDLTTGTPAKRILLFALPLFIGNVFQQAYNMADTFIVGRTISVEALAAVGSSGAIMFLVIGFLQYMTSGFSIVTAQYFGARKKGDVRKSFCVSIILSAGAGLLLMALSVPFLGDILTLMRTPPELFPDTLAYTRSIFLGLWAAVAYNLLANTILALGDSKTPLLFLIITCILNVVLDLTFILWFGWGVVGAARATIISQGISALLCMVYISKKQPGLILRKKDWSHVTPADLWKSLRLGIPMGFQISIIAVGVLILQWALNKLGPTAVAAYTVAQKIDVVAVMPLASFGLAMATYTGQNFGAGNIARIRTGVRQCCAMSLTVSVLGGAGVIVYGHYLGAFFMGDNLRMDVLDLAQVYLNINGVMYWSLALLFIFRFSLQGLGNSTIPTAAGIMELAMRVIVAVFFVERLGFKGVSAAGPLAWIGACIPLIGAYAYTIRNIDAKRTRTP